MDAAVRGGFRIIEFTLTIPKALDLIREFSARPGLIVGAGTVLSAEQAKASVVYITTRERVLDPWLPEWLDPVVRACAGFLIDALVDWAKRTGFFTRFAEFGFAAAGEGEQTCA